MRLVALSPLAVLLACNGADNNLGTFNTPPNVSISSPVDGDSFDEGTSITFEGRAGDDGGPEALSLVWSSDLADEALDDTPADSEGLVTFTTANLVPGNHAITLTAYDAEGESGTADIGVSVVDLPEAPEIAIIHPTGGESGIEGEPFRFVAQVSDAQDGPQDLSVGLTSDVDEYVCALVVDAVGVATCDAALSGGDHTLTFSVTDTEEITFQATTVFAVTRLTDIDNDGDGFTEAQGDCDDTNNQILPSAPEVENGLDDDCDTITDEGTRAYDDDRDGYSENQGDCNDATTAVSPVATEACGNAVDDDCDTQIDEAFATGCATWYQDSDGDTWGSSTTQCLCSPAGDYTANRSGDCYDANGYANPSATAYQTTQRGDGSYDYNCDNVETKQFTAQYSCTFGLGICVGSSTDGWVNGTPACGTTGTWGTGCSAGFFSCGAASTFSAYQACL